MRDAPAAPVVLDTNVLVAGLRSPHGASFRLLELLQQNRLHIEVLTPQQWLQQLSEEPPCLP
ncbi:hypothetical protein CLI92_10510 [Vandammella animalimorsus]|uniref:PIN domain-containing protein n=1 Tax=Vandammella animalimorsus TaxID=2029117 RepID=A0A2A2T439_9BURK|nr:PIN domain-containing protein [Vandammella animalimorsus]PAT31662.1 hypothetical protein CK626_09215 [Vandammella animalimorsus]PAT42256.1 hypothetical protein CK621_10145 [Vandammella animalimorsus]PAX16220.1 hypothetical protein CLI92_10510 [Vandammella animalimorsus]PAX18249.1 hypothetical protein CLI93_12040 [Vandammella animalimorsus]